MAGQRLTNLTALVLCILPCLAGCGAEKKTDPNVPVVYISSTSQFYHTAECSALGADGKAYAKSAVVAKGYKPCPQCQATGAPAPVQQAAPQPVQQPAQDPVTLLREGMTVAEVNETLGVEGQRKAKVSTREGVREVYEWRIDSRYVKANFIAGALTAWDVESAAGAQPTAFQPPAQQSTPQRTRGTAYHPPQQGMVYIAPQSGEKYHATRGCRGLRNAQGIQAVTRDQAIAQGYEACKICGPQ